MDKPLSNGYTTILVVVDRFSKACLSSGYHHQTNGQTERKIQEIGRYLPTYCQYLPWAEYAQNSLQQETTGLTLFLQLPCNSESPHYISPFSITRQINEVTYELKLPDHYRISPTLHVSLLKPYTNLLLPPTAERKVPPPLEIDTNEAIFRVKEILDSSGSKAVIYNILSIWKDTVPRRGHGWTRTTFLSHLFSLTSINCTQAVAVLAVSYRR